MDYKPSELRNPASRLAICHGAKDTAILGMRMPHVFVAVWVSCAPKHQTISPQNGLVMANAKKKKKLAATV